MRFWKTSAFTEQDIKKMKASRPFLRWQRAERDSALGTRTGPLQILLPLLLSQGCPLTPVPIFQNGNLSMSLDVHGAMKYLKIKPKLLRITA